MTPYPTAYPTVIAGVAVTRSLPATLPRSGGLGPEAGLAAVATLVAIGWQLRRRRPM